MQFTLSKQYSPIRQAITANYRLDEKSAVDSLMKTLDFTPEQEQRITDNAIKLIKKLRQLKQKQYGADALMQEFSLSSEEGVALMCLAVMRCSCSGEKSNVFTKESTALFSSKR